jgi:hypothetical protein
MDVDPGLPLRCLELRETIGREQSSVYSNVWLAGSGVMTAIVGVALAMTVALVPGVLALVIGAVFMLPIGVIRAGKGLRRVSETAAELERIEPKPLPPARVVT